MEKHQITGWIGLAEYYRLVGNEALAQEFFRRAANRPISDGNLIDVCYAESQLPNCRVQLVKERLENFAPIKKKSIILKKEILEIKRNLR